MKYGKITIEHNFESGHISVQTELVDGTVWVTKHQIAYLLDVHVQSVTASLKTIFKSKELFEHQVIKYHDYKDKNGLTNITELYNLDVIIALSFRMQGGYCRLFREWICGRCKEAMSEAKKQPIIIQIHAENNHKEKKILN